MRTRWPVLLVGSVSLGLATAALARTPVDSICPGALLVVQPGDISLRDKPQDRFLFIFYGPGREIERVAKGDRLKVERTSIVKTAFGDQKWAFVEHVGSSSRGWVFVGSPGDADSCCVEAVSAPPRPCP